MALSEDVRQPEAGDFAVPGRGFQSAEGTIAEGTTAEGTSVEGAGFGPGCAAEWSQRSGKLGWLSDEMGTLEWREGTRGLKA